MDYKEQAEQISLLLARINKSIHQTVAKHLEQFGLTVPQLMVLRLLFKSNTLSVSELSKKMGLTSSTVSGIIDRLEKEGYVVRQRDEQDRRVVYVCLTARSRKLKEELPIFDPGYFGNWIKDLEPEQVAKIVDALAILARVVRPE